MSKVGKKATTKAIAYCSKISGQELPKSTSWATISEIILEGYVYDIHTKCKSQGDITIMKLYKEEPEELIETFTIPNELVFIEKEGDWEWNYIWKTLAEFLMKYKPNRKAKKKKPVQVDQTQLATEINELREAIKTAKGFDKKKLIKVFNEKSKLVVKEEPKELTPEINLDEIKRKKSALYMKIRAWNRKGKDTTELETEMNKYIELIKQAKNG